jgi:hypothetical protein
MPQLSDRQLELRPWRGLIVSQQAGRNIKHPNTMLSHVNAATNARNKLVVSNYGCTSKRSTSSNENATRDKKPSAHFADQGAFALAPHVCIAFWMVISEELAEATLLRARREEKLSSSVVEPLEQRLTWRREDHTGWNSV